MPDKAREAYLAGTPGQMIVSSTPPTNLYAGAVFYTGTISVSNGMNGLSLATPVTTLFFSWPRKQAAVLTLF